MAITVNCSNLQLTQNSTIFDIVAQLQDCNSKIMYIVNDSIIKFCEKDISELPANLSFSHKQVYGKSMGYIFKSSIQDISERNNVKSLNNKYCFFNAKVATQLMGTFSEHKSTAIADNASEISAIITIHDGNNKYILDNKERKYTVSKFILF